MPTPFVHLHNHSEFSLLDGATKLKDMVKYAVEMEMPAIALTDHGMMYGAMEFYLKCKAAGIKPLVGVELYIATRGRTQRDPKKDGSQHLVALAKNFTGYQNLMKLTTKASLEGFYYKPRVDKELLAEHSEGLIICSACLGAEIPQTLMKKSYEEAKSAAAWYREVFGEDFYLEIQDHGIEAQASVNKELLRMSREMGIKLVATNDAHYLKADDAEAHDVLVCIQTGTTVEDPKRMKYEPRNFYLKDYEEMLKVFGSIAPEALENTLEIADKCNLEIEMGRVPMPAVDLPEGRTAHGHMTELCREGLERRIKTVSQVHRDRLDYELDIIEQTGFSQYFLIVMDISNYSRNEGIFFGVRGSAAGSLASYCLGITDLDPIEYNLTFERFLNPERVTMPDIDMDFEDARRADVIKHVTEKYGTEQVAYITTFGTLGAKAALRDAGRALALPMSEVDKIAKMVPALPVGITIHKAMYGDPDKGYSGNPDMLSEYQNNPLANKLITTAQKLEGISRHASTHAAGIMIADKPLVNYTPLAKTADGSLVTQYPHSSLEAIGLLKMDFLGLSNLTILANAVRLIKQTRDEVINVWDIPLGDDPRADAAYEMVGRGETTGIFQLESQGMRKYVVDLKPNSVKELAAMVALYRPGPMAHIPRFIRGKFDPDSVSYTHPTLEPILAETYGVIVYQDQVLKIVQAIAGFSLGQADLLRRAMGKKKASEMEKQRANFLKGAEEKGVKAKTAGAIFDEIEPFAGYAFNGCLDAKTTVQKPDGTRIHISAAFAAQTPELMAMWEDGVIRPHKVARIVKTGRKPLFEIRTKGNRCVRATGEHRFLTTAGYLPVSEMSAGTELIVQPRPTSEAQREARRKNAAQIVQTPEVRRRASERMKAYQAARPLDDKIAHMKTMHKIHPDLWRKGQEAATLRNAWLHENDPEWREVVMQKSFANVRAAYDTGPGYGHCSIASNGMWCASGPERAMCEWLIERGVEFEMHKVLPGGRMCDFYFDGVYFEMDGMDRVAEFFAAKYGELPYVVVTPEDFRAKVSAHLDLAHAENGDPIVSIIPCGTGETYDIEMAEGGPKNFIANRIVSHNSHAACYAMVAYQTAYLKANYPAEYLAALMGAYIDNTEKVVATLEECGRLGVKVLPPDINGSALDFTVHGTDETTLTGAVQFGLLAIKNVGKAPIETILAAREKGGRFVSLEDFCIRVFAEGLTSKSVIEMLIKAGTFASIEPNRRALIEQLDDCVNIAQRGAKDAKAGLISLFGGDGPGSPPEAEEAKAVSPLAILPDFPRGELLAMEKELLGLYLSEHPVKPFEPELRKKYRAIRADAIKETTPNQEVVVGGMVGAMRTHYTKKGEPMLFMTLEDTTGSVQVTCFPGVFADCKAFVLPNAVLAIKGKASHRERFGGKGTPADGEGDSKSAQVEVLADRVHLVAADAMSADARPRAVHVRVDLQNRTLLRMLRETLGAREGGSPLYLHVETPDGEAKIKSPLTVDPDEGLLSQVRQMLGGGQSRRVWVE